MKLDRRETVIGMAALTLGATAQEPSRPARRPAPRAAFVSHGAPSLALDAERGRELAAWGAELERPRALVVVSAHWERAPVTIGTARRIPLLHDYGGFARELRDVTYDAPAAAELADALEAGLADFGVARDDARPWDHGVWVPLLHMFPARDVPLVQLSLPSALGPAELARLGARLRELVDERVLLVGSGGFVHNLGRIDWSERTPPPAWATDFEAWGRGVLERGDLDALVDFRTKAPAPSLAHPSLEHWLPLLVVAGAAPRALRYPVEGFEYGSLSRLTVELGSASA
jgi:4,5-DOPA dioxygenase extradiol